ncbi:MAG: hypothetical protein KKH94_13120 [Candidatus Omnitrophica bacterium]|nr:hypothetical protein [Candidatus Omnitrophota bacterium]
MPRRNLSPYLKTIIPVISVCCTMLLVCSCAHYRICTTYEVVNTESDAASKVYYAITKNNVLIPEFVIDSQGHYPTSPEAAWEQFLKRQSKVEKYIDNKYKIPNNGAYQIQRWGLMIGLMAVSPIAIPITYVSEFSEERDDESSSKNIWHSIKRYFALSMNEPNYVEPEIKDEFETMTIGKADTNPNGRQGE